MHSATISKVIRIFIQFCLNNVFFTLEMEKSSTGHSIPIHIQKQQVIRHSEHPKWYPVMKDLWSPSLRPTYRVPTSRLTAGTCGHEEGCENRELLTACDDVPLIIIKSGNRCYKPSTTCLLCGAGIFSTCTVHQVSLRSRRGGGHGRVVHTIK